MGVKFGMEEGAKGRLLSAKVQKTQKLGFFAARWRQNKPIETSVGTLVYTMGLL